MTNRIFLVSLASAGIIILAAIITFLLSGTGACRDFSAGVVSTPTTNIKVAIAENHLDQARGLGGCKSLPKKTGMYFPYATKQNPVFWMKGMRMSIDIVWIADGKVVEVDAYIPPPTGQLDQDLIRYSAPRPIDAVLEVAAGKAKEYGLIPGAQIRIKK
ncbi:MAG: DUF192 domain-containing protein [Candidatus Andersenbacteria bacterium]|nr:DUF192 domain-containing protein [Candidatus Andersenbacteria bacterium]